MLVVRKIVRGLCYANGLPCPIADEQVKGEILRYYAPEEILAAMRYGECCASVFKYWYITTPAPNLHSVWILEVYERRRFICWVQNEQQYTAAKPDVP
jgi:hypothetical protein